MAVTGTGCLRVLSLLLALSLLASTPCLATSDALGDVVSALTGCKDKNAIYFVSDYNENQVRAFHGTTGKYIGAVLPLNNTPCVGCKECCGGPDFLPTAISQPNGIVVYKDVLYVVNQNGLTPYNAGVLAFQVPASVKAGILESSQLPFKRLFPDPVDQNNPAVALDSPRGIVIGGPGPLMYVADPGPPYASKPQVLVADPTPPYAIRGFLDISGAPPEYNWANRSLLIGPEGLAFGPDGYLYVSIRSFFVPPPPPGVPLLFGAILRFDVSKTPGVFKDVFASTIGATDCAKFMHRVEGLTWGPKLLGQHQQLLYATGYTGSAGAPPPVNDVDPDLNDKVLIFTPDGKCVDYFITEPPALLAANKRTDAAAFVFGPKNELYFPLNAFAAGNNNNEFTGGYRAYDVKRISNHSAPYETIVAPNNPILRPNEPAVLAAPFYSTFVRTNPGTLAYECPGFDSLLHDG